MLHDYACEWYLLDPKENMDHASTYEIHSENMLAVNHVIVKFLIPECVSTPVSLPTNGNAQIIWKKHTLRC